MGIHVVALRLLASETVRMNWWDGSESVSMQHEVVSIRMTSQKEMAAISPGLPSAHSVTGIAELFPARLFARREESARFSLSLAHATSKRTYHTTKKNKSRNRDIQHSFITHPQPMWGRERDLPTKPNQPRYGPTSALFSEPDAAPNDNRQQGRAEQQEAHLLARWRALEHKREQRGAMCPRCACRAHVERRTVDGLSRPRGERGRGATKPKPEPTRPAHATFDDVQREREAVCVRR